MKISLQRARKFVVLLKHNFKVSRSSYSMLTYYSDFQTRSVFFLDGVDIKTMHKIYDFCIEMSLLPNGVGTLEESGIKWHATVPINDFAPAQDGVVALHIICALS